VPKSKPHPRRRQQAKRSASSSSRRTAAVRARGDSREEARASVRPQWSGTLSFGLVSIPVDLFPANRTGGVALRMLAPDGTPLRRRYVCPEEDVEAQADELVRGYEWKPGQHVVVTDEELESLEPQKSRDIDLRLFVARDTIDPIYFVRSYFLAPSGDSSKAYHLLTEVMQKSKRAGIATFVMREHEYLVAITAEHGLLHAHALRFQSELRAASGAVAERTKPTPADVKRFERLIAKHARSSFDLDRLHDEAAEQLRKLAERKARRGTDVIETAAAKPEDEAGADIVDLMQVLKKSLGAKSA
jgi:DNA end-binding protein Ku